MRDMDLNFYMPISLVPRSPSFPSILTSQVDENMARAHKRGAVKNQKFWFRINIHDDLEAEMMELTIDEIINGSSSTAPPLLCPRVSPF